MLPYKLFLSIQLCVLLAYLTPSESSLVSTPGSCRDLFSRSCTSFWVWSHPSSHTAIWVSPSHFSGSHSFLLRRLTLLRINLFCSSAPLTIKSPLSAEDKSPLIGCRRGDSQPIPLSLNYYLPLISQPFDTFWDAPVHFLPLACHASSPAVKILTVTLLHRARGCLLHLQPGLGSSLVAGCQVIQV